MAALRHRLDIYDTELFLATERRQWAPLRRRLSFLAPRPPDAAGSCQFATWQPKRAGLTVPHLVFWIDVRQHGNQFDLVNTCAHEASHGAGELLDYVGHVSQGVDEPRAYLTGWLTSWMWDTCSPKIPT